MVFLPGSLSFHLRDSSLIQERHLQDELGCWVSSSRFCWGESDSTNGPVGLAQHSHAVVHRACRAILACQGSGRRRTALCIEPTDGNTRGLACGFRETLLAASVDV